MLAERAINLRFLAMFFFMSAIFIGGYHALPKEISENTIVKYFAAAPAAIVIDALHANIEVKAESNRIVSPIASLNILKGCDGLDVLLLLFAAIIAAFRSVKWTALGLLAGIVLVFLLNQVRIVIIFYIVAHRRSLFEFTHGFAAPLLILLLIAAYYFYWYRSSVANS